MVCRLGYQCWRRTLWTPDVEGTPGCCESSWMWHWWGCFDSDLSSSHRRLPGCCNKPWVACWIGLMWAMCELVVWTQHFLPTRYLIHFVCSACEASTCATCCQWWLPGRNWCWHLRRLGDRLRVDGVGWGWGVWSSVHVRSHQRSSSTVPHGRPRGINGLLPNIPSINCSEVRYMLPSGMTNEAWDNCPCSFCTCLRVCAVVHNHSCIVLMYFVRFVVVKLTVLLSRFQMNPMKTGVEEKGASLESSHGIPRRLEIWSMWLKSYACDAMVSLGCFEVKSWTACVQSSVNSSWVPSANGSPLNHQQPFPWASCPVRWWHVPLFCTSCYNQRWYLGVNGRKGDRLPRRLRVLCLQLERYLNQHSRPYHMSQLKVHNQNTKRCLLQKVQACSWPAQQAMGVMGSCEKLLLHLWLLLGSLVGVSELRHKQYGRFPTCKGKEQSLPASWLKVPRSSGVN